MTNRERQLLQLLQANPLISQQELAETLGISRSAVATHLTNLTAKGAIKGRGYILSERRYSVVIGGANMDILGTPGQALTPGSSTPGTVSYSPGGVGRNIAENLARLGEDCYLIAPVGDDHSGRQLTELSSQAGIDTSQMVTIPGHATSSYLSLVDEQGEMQQAIADMAILDAFGPDYLRKHLGLLARAELLVLDTNLKNSTLECLFGQLPEQRFFVDCVSSSKAPKIRPFLSRIHTLKPNLAEAEAISGIHTDPADLSDSALQTLAHWFHQEGVERLFISLGSEGLFYSHRNGESCHHKLSCNTVINSNGAGDALMAALCHGWLQQMPADQTCRFALAAANLALASQTTINPEMSRLNVAQLLSESM
ncbi:PfkB family carbohydrate kinase [Aliamphritea spongicola]|uniref:PfkB family carbohydrate kinase n=1 Tax=Aliamphritea spongicola TaxID=707589 RepID=UPI00196B31FE|nr:PfkB family carbohydrate kinase [Aliamphritea spongicola]MBN3562300.1 winged helix-turn-helix transcriptional regulator [Aliamphritea spongicola]